MTKINRFEFYLALVVLKIAVITSVAITSPAFAEETAALCPDNCTSPPQTPPAFTYDKAERAFQNARKPRSAELIGGYFLVGVTSVSKVFFNEIDRYNDPMGLKNPDNSILTLSFSETSDFLGNSPQPTVLVSNLGLKNPQQGPYVVNFDNTEDSACFAQYAYSGLVKDKINHFNYECRLIGQSNSKLLCAIRMVFSPETVQTGNPDQVRYNMQIGAYMAFVRK